MMYGINCDHICAENRIVSAKFKVRNGANPKKGKQHDNADVTFQIVPTTDRNKQARSDLSESVCI